MYIIYVDDFIIDVINIIILHTIHYVRKMIKFHID